MHTAGEDLEFVLARLKQAEIAFHDGDAAPRSALWSHNDSVTLFGAVMTKRGWREIEPAFQWLASRFSRCASFDYEIIAADVSGDLAYVVGIEHTTAAIGGGTPKAYALRVTTIFRHEDGEWKIVHRHGDRVAGDSAAEQLGGLGLESSTE